MGGALARGYQRRLATSARRHVQPQRHKHNLEAATVGEGTLIVSFGPDVVSRITSVCGIGEVAFTTMRIFFGPAA